MATRSLMQIVCGVSTAKKFMEVCVKESMLPDETFKVEETYVLFFDGIVWGTGNFYNKIREVFDELDGEDEEPYKMLRIGESLTDLEERKNICGSDVYDNDFYIIRDFSRKGNYFSTGGV